MCALQGGNQIGDDGAKSIAAAVEGNGSLRQLHLVRRRFGFVAPVAFVDPLSSWCMGADVCCAELQPIRRRRRKINCSGCGRKRQLEAAAPGETTFWFCCSCCICGFFVIVVHGG
jgi:hypothetical protein